MRTMMMMVITLTAAFAATGRPAAAQDARADVEAILALNGKWVQAVAARDFEWISNLYAPQGHLMPPGAAGAQGREAVGDGWRRMLADPNYSLTFGTKQIHVAKSGDYAYDLGTYRSATGTGDAKTEDRGKYVVVWAKIDGRWQVVADIFNSDGPQGAAPK
jgi:uncharacterized protein (TIGR02246 family)